MKWLQLFPLLGCMLLAECPGRCLAEGDLTSGHQAVIELTTDFFKAIVKTHDLVLIFFYTDDCSHCEAMKPAFEEAAQQLSDHQPPIAFGSIDSRANGWLRNKVLYLFARCIRSICIT